MLSTRLCFDYCFYKEKNIISFVVLISNYILWQAVYTARIVQKNNMFNDILSNAIIFCADVNVFLALHVETVEVKMIVKNKMQ